VASFYFDLGSPLSYLAAERVLSVMPAPAEWQPVLASELTSVAPVLEAVALMSDEVAPMTAAVDTLAQASDEALRAEIERRAYALGLQPLRWPEPFPFDSSFAMRVATYARSIGRAVAFAQAAFRQAYAGGRNLEEPDNVLIAAAACEMHPKAVLAAARLRSTDGELHLQTVRAARAGVRALPAVVVDGLVFAGDAMLERAATHMRASARRAATG
jgi:2-hydroxychromene-2-carboxylate isomerase